MLNTVGRFIYTKYCELLYVEHCGKIYSHKILGITLCWTLWEDLFTQNNEEYCMLSTVGRLFTQHIGDYFMLSTVRRFIYTKYWGILYVEHCGKIYLHRILGITSCWTLWEYLFTQNTGDYFMWEDLFTQHTEEYCMLSTVGRFMYTQYWGILYVEHYGKNYLHKILGITLCWTLGRLFTQNIW
jgi:hypothetical protein